MIIIYLLCKYNEHSLTKISSACDLHWHNCSTPHIPVRINFHGAARQSIVASSTYRDYRSGNWLRNSGAADATTNRIPKPSRHRGTRLGEYSRCTITEGESEMRQQRRIFTVCRIGIYCFLFLEFFFFQTMRDVQPRCNSSIPLSNGIVSGAARLRNVAITRETAEIVGHFDRAGLLKTSRLKLMFKNF